MSTSNKVDASRYMNEILFHAAVAAPWEVPLSMFVSIVAVLANGEVRGDDARDCEAFFALACNAAAESDNRAADARAIYRAACRTVHDRGGKVHEDGVPA